MSSASFPIAPRFPDVVREPEATGSDARLRALVEAEHAFVWRSLRRLGVPMSDVDDAVQKVFLVAARKLSGVASERERPFLFATAVRIAANERRAERRKRSDGPDALEGLASEARSPEKQAHDRALLDALLDPLPIELRSVVVLFELEQLTTEEIAEMLDLPAGTVASRLRRARARIEDTMRRLRASEGGRP